LELLDFLLALLKLRELLNFCWPFQDLEGEPNGMKKPLMKFGGKVQKIF
jgi:hypothetical protein